MKLHFEAIMFRDDTGEVLARIGGPTVALLEEELYKLEKAEADMLHDIEASRLDSEAAREFLGDGKDDDSAPDEKVSLDDLVN